MTDHVLSPAEEDQLLRLYCVIADATSDARVQARNMMPSALQCFLHVFEERVGTYGFLVVRHILISPLWTGCDRPIAPGALVQVGNDVVDRSWCRSWLERVHGQRFRRSASSYARVRCVAHYSIRLMDDAASDQLKRRDVAARADAKRAVEVACARANRAETTMLGVPRKRTYHRTIPADCRGAEDGSQPCHESVARAYNEMNGARR
jgi:hypothetical protein